jgi:hypothetical protein
MLKYEHEQNAKKEVIRRLAVCIRIDRAIQNNPCLSYRQFFIGHRESILNKAILLDCFVYELMISVTSRMAFLLSGIGNKSQS